MAVNRDRAIRSNLDSVIQMLTEAIVLTDADFSSGVCQAALCDTAHKHNSEANDNAARFGMLSHSEDAAFLFRVP